MKKIFVIYLFFIINYNISYSQFEGYNHPELKWETIETEHFIVYYHQGLERTPRILAKIAEEIYNPITSLYNFEPDSKVHIIVKDTDDYSGGAAYFYDNKIEVWATPLNFILRGTHKWLRDVLTHEFTHIISIQKARKMPRRVPALFAQGLGYEKEKRKDVLYGFPNVLISYPFAGTVVPMWFAEGMAQFGADKFGYDYWDSHRDMILRMRTLNNDLLSLNEMGVFGKNSIGNESTYNQGYSLVKYIVHKYGEDAQSKLAKSMGSFFTFSFDNAVKKVLGISQEQLYNDWKIYIQSHYSEKTKIISENQKFGRIIENEGSANLFPTWSPDSENYVYISNGKSDYLSATKLYINSLNKGNRRLLTSNVSSSLSWSKDGKKVVYSKTELWKNGSHYDDIYIYDFENKKEIRLTEGMRARYPAFAPDGKRLSFVIGSDGNYNLAIIDVDIKDIKYLTNFTDGEEIYQSSWSPDGSKIVFCLSGNDSRNIAIVDSNGENMKYLMNGKEDARDPVFSPDGKKIYFSSDVTGIFNIYSYNIESATVEQITNVLGGAFMPSVNEKGQLIYSLYLNDGYKIALLEDINPISKENSVYISNYPEKLPDVNYDDSKIPTFNSNQYQSVYSMTSIVPRFMMDYGKPKIGITAFSNEILDKYNLYAAGSINPDFDYDLMAILEYKRLKPTLFLELYGISRHTTESDTMLTLPTLLKIKLSLFEADFGAKIKINDKQNFRTAFIYSRYNGRMKYGEPFLSIFRYNYFIGRQISFEWNYSGRMAMLDDQINPSGGRDIQFKYVINFNKFLRDFDFQKSFSFEVYDNYNYNSFFLDWKEYITIPFGIERNSFSYNFQGGLIDKSVNSFFYFFGGGILGMKGYSYYTIEGNKMLFNSFTYRTPLLKNIDIQFGPLYFDKMYGSVSFFYGNNWDGNKLELKDFKKSIDFQVRMDAFSYYSYPTKIAFDVAYGFDRFNTLSGIMGKEWKFYFQLLFEYL